MRITIRAQSTQPERRVCVSPKTTRVAAKYLNRAASALEADLRDPNKRATLAITPGLSHVEALREEILDSLDEINASLRY